MPVFGIATATVMLVAKSLGQNDLQGIKQIISRSFWISFLTMLPLALTIFLFGSPLTALYTKDPGALLPPIRHFVLLLGTPLTAGPSSIPRSGKVRQRASSLLCDHYRHVGDSDWLRLSDGVSLGWGLPGIWAGTLLDNGFRWIFLKTLYHRTWKE